jgi:hypothetical protein
MGRPKSPPGDKRGWRVTICLTDAEAKELTKAAKKDSDSISPWTRKAALKMARGTL